MMTRKGGSTLWNHTNFRTKIPGEHDSDPLQPELLEKMWAVYYHKYQGRQKKKTYLSNATELIKLSKLIVAFFFPPPLLLGFTLTTSIFDKSE